METKQTSIPLKESIINKKWFAIPLTIVVAFLIVIIGYYLAGDAKAETYVPQSSAADQIYASWASERDTRECEEQKKVAQANYNDVLHGLKVDKDMNSLKEKLQKNCEPGFIPAAKALSFDLPGISLSNPQNDGNNNINFDSTRNNKSGNTRGKSEETGEKHPVHKGSPENLDLDKLAYAVSVAETSGCTKGTGRTRNNCFGIMAWTKAGIRYPRHFATKEESFEEFKRIWAKNYKVFPTLKLASRWTGNDHPDTWLATVTQKYYE